MNRLRQVRNTFVNKIILHNLNIFISLALLGSFTAGTAFSAQRGKISGTVKAEDGMPVSGANIIVEDTRFGAAANLDGHYYILAIPPGRYTILVSALGFRSTRVEGVLVSSGHSTNIDVTLQGEALELEPVSVYFKQAPVELNETSQRISIGGEEARQMPVRLAEEMVLYQAGVVLDEDGTPHIRGGRSGEIAYIVDGIRIEDPLYGNQPLNITCESLQELQVLSGTFNAEYGEAMSGIVNVVTREGTDKFQASIEYESPMINPSPYRMTDWVEENSDAVRDSVTGNSLFEETDIINDRDVWIPTPGRISLVLSGPVIYVPKTTFFINAIHSAENSHLPFGDRWTRDITGKIATSTNSGKLSLSFGMNVNDYQKYSHTWKYVPEQYHRHFDQNKRLSANWIHNITSSLYYEIFAGYFQREHDIKIFQDWDDYGRVGYTPQDFTFQRYFYDESDWSDTWRESNTWIASTGAKASWQMNPIHLWKGGFEIRRQNIELEDIRDLRMGPNGEREGLADIYTEEPVEASVFLQDKIELDYLVLNAGLRLDYVDPQAEGWADPENPTIALEEVEPSTQISPRLGLAHPISDSYTLHFAYGHFFQFPDYVNLFLNSSDLNPDTLSNRMFDAVGNPGLKPQKTVAYEVGLNGVLTPEWGFTATAFYKDITDLIGTRQVRVGTAYNYAAFVNIDYASVTGFEIGLRRVLADNWSLQGNYTYSVAKGNSSEPTTGYWDAYENIPTARQEYYMDFDRRHVSNMLLTWQSGFHDYPRLFNTTALQGVGTGLIVSITSGLPYTPYSGAGEQLSLRNSERISPTIRVDLRLAKTVLYEPVKVTLFGNIDNIFDRINPLRVNSRTGEPWETTLIGNEVNFDQIHDPGKVGVPRIIKVGMKIDF
ncbi:MAG: TonB-dependent receptor [Candidatus Electryonea clarkiae]|nr:TonB-dependent receptor [Candidatus Electryonea clarkiae]MDP8285510.1 TonB-dependent receptor [Candidatus Electryonea clarkiae]